MRLIQAVVIGLVVASCTHVTHVMGPDGTDHLAISCGSRIERCYKAAAKRCPYGYSIVDRTSGISGYVNPYEADIRSSDTMLIKCKTPDAPATAAVSVPAPAAPSAAP